MVGWVKLLNHAHKPDKIALVAHQRCAGHPVDDDQHEHDVLEAAMQLKEKTGFGGRCWRWWRPIHRTRAGA